MERYNQSEPDMPLTRIVEEVERHLNTERVGRFKMTFPRGDSTHFEIGFQNKPGPKRLSELICKLRKIPSHRFVDEPHELQIEETHTLDGIQVIFRTPLLEAIEDNPLTYAPEVNGDMIHALMHEALAKEQRKTRLRIYGNLSGQTLKQHLHDYVTARLKTEQTMARRACLEESVFPNTARRKLKALNRNTN